MLRFFSILILSCVLFSSVQGQSEDQEKVYKVTEQMPLFEGCDEVAKVERTNCANEKLVRFIIENLKYPKEAQDAKVEGKVIVTFVIDKDGSVRDSKVVRGIGSGCDEAARNVVDSMPDWIPGNQDGKDVSVQYTLPFTFKLPKKKE